MNFLSPVSTHSARISRDSLAHYAQINLGLAEELRAAQGCMKVADDKAILYYLLYIYSFSLLLLTTVTPTGQMLRTHFYGG